MKLQVVGQMIAFTERETLVSGTVNKYRAEFVFCSVRSLFWHMK